MKNIIIAVLLACIGTSHAQINIGKSKSPINLYVSKHKQGVFDKVKSAKTLFVVPKVVDAEKFKALISEVWNFNETLFVDQDTFKENLEKYISQGNSIIQLIDNGYTKQKTGGVMGPGTRTVGEYIVFKFMMTSNYENIKKGKKGKLKYDYLNVAEIFFTPNIRYRQDISSKMRIGSMDKINAKYGEEPGFYNFNMGYIKNYFQELNRRLSNSENLVIEDGIKKEDKIKELKEKTLYAPKWILKKYNALAATWGKTRTAEDIFGKYNHKYEIIDNEELSNKIINGEDFYYLMHTQFNQKKIISIIHSLTGEIIYLKEEGSYNLTDSDIKGFAKIIK
ncbi:hypothetical protein AWE51_00340 [Aquimarina aggregata]|uniref:Uncharacterized protein n=1 Tax=Aquimarina aggregata TaxID=1642818 RepID=A0A163BZU9_9FLAO|nr:hypothetical protein [Aquimarina aggregata]KZS41927.1 hypothetical protein AWE51_00340 [Aquimarina aggregata]